MYCHSRKRTLAAYCVVILIVCLFSVFSATTALADGSSDAPPPDNPDGAGISGQDSDSTDPSLLDIIITILILT